MKLSLHLFSAITVNNGHFQLFLGELYRLFGRRITAGLVETTNIVSKLMKYSEVIFLRFLLFCITQQECAYIIFIFL